MTKKEIIRNKKLAHQLKMLEAIGWKKDEDEVEFKS